MIGQTTPTAFQLLYMILAIDLIDGRGLSNEARHWLLPKKSKVMLYLLFISQLNKRRFKQVKFAMCSLVMSLCSHDLPVTSLITIIQYSE